jgi:hypothetical protein
VTFLTNLPFTQVDGAGLEDGLEVGFGVGVGVGAGAFWLNFTEMVGEE